MKWLPEDKTYVFIPLACFLVFGLSLLSFLNLKSPKPPTQPENPTINVTVTELVWDEALKAELDATKSKSRAVEQELSTMVLKQEKMAVELNQALVNLAQLRANQQPDLATRYTELNTKYQQQYGELLELKATYDVLLADYNELVRVHALCGEEE